MRMLYDEEEEEEGHREISRDARNGKDFRKKISLVIAFISSKNKVIIL